MYYGILFPVNIFLLHYEFAFLRLDQSATGKVKIEE